MFLIRYAELLVIKNGILIVCSNCDVKAKLFRDGTESYVKHFYGFDNENIC